MIDTTAIKAMDFDSLLREISFAEGFGDDSDPNVKEWRLALIAERDRRSRRVLDR